MEQDPEQTEEESPHGSGINVEVVRSYLAFARSAIVRRKLLIAAVAILGTVLTLSAAKYLPRTYTCKTVMMTMSSGVLESDRGSQALAGAEGLILSHDSLERIVEATGLKKTYFERRPAVLKVKDKLIRSVFGPMDDKTMMAVLIGTLGSRIHVSVEKEMLTIEVDWSDGETAAEVAEAAREDFLRSRHTAEISAFQDKMAILDAHAVTLRADIDTLAQEMKKVLAAKRAALEEEVKAEAKKDGAKAPSLARRVAHRPVSDAQLPELRERLTAAKQRLAAAENGRVSQMRDEQAKLDEMKLRLTPSHPQVIIQQERVGIASQVPSELALLRAEVQDMESLIRQRESMQATQKGSGTTNTIAGGAGAELPSEILGLLDERDADPALAAQISGAVTRYGSLRDDIRGSQIALDTAQAAFGRRYQVTVPVEVPSSPTKPKKAVILGAGLAISLLLALLLPILLEVKRDVVVERWQVHQLQLPVLGELRLPSSKGS